MVSTTVLDTPFPEKVLHAEKDIAAGGEA